MIPLSTMCPNRNPIEILGNAFNERFVAVAPGRNVVPHWLPQNSNAAALVTVTNGVSFPAPLINLLQPTLYGRNCEVEWEVTLTGSTRNICDLFLGMGYNFTGVTPPNGIIIRFDSGGGTDVCGILQSNGSAFVALAMSSYSAPDNIRLRGLASVVGNRVRFQAWAANSVAPVFTLLATASPFNPGYCIIYSDGVNAGFTLHAIRGRVW